MKIEKQTTTTVILNDDDLSKLIEILGCTYTLLYKHDKEYEKSTKYMMFIREFVLIAADESEADNVISGKYELKP